jgi:hypothetical protein
MPPLQAQGWKLQKRRLTAWVFLFVFGISSAAVSEDKVVYSISPNDTDPAIGRFLNPNLVIFNRSTPRTAELLVFLPGTVVNPAARSPFPHVRGFFDTAADAGYRVVALQYDNYPALLQICARDPDLSCAANFHQRRIYGENVTDAIDDTPAESIVNRLAKLLQYLDARHPGEGWGGYLKNGKPAWNRIAVAGHSQGATMAAFIAKRETLARVVLLSGPADSTIPERQLAPWLSWRSETPIDRWYAMYHARERRADVLQRAAEALGIAPSHIRIVSMEPNRPRNVPDWVDLYHASVNLDGVTPRSQAGEPLYRPDWIFLLGHPR